MKSKIGMVLSGGGVRGMAHIGFLYALEERGIRPDAISGASAGALVGALYAGGYTPGEMLSFFKTTPLFEFSFYSSQKPGLLDSEKYRVFFEKYFPLDDFSALKIPLYISTTDLGNAENVIFSEGELINPLLASASIPTLFTPLEINGALYSDGGILNNFPAEPLIGRYDIILGSYVSPVPKLDINYFTSMVKVFRRAADLRLYAEAKSKFANCDFVLETHEAVKYNLLNTQKIEEMYEIGYDEAKRQMNNIEAVLAQKS